MGSYKLRQEALDDLERIWFYGLENWGLEAADAYQAAFFEHFQSLADQPLRYAALDDIRPGYRRSVCGKESVYYRIVGDTVEIMAILGKQDAQGWL